MITRMDPGANWYKVGRIVLGRLEEPGALAQNLRVLVGRGLVVEKETDEPLPRLEVTQRGRAIVESIRGKPDG